MVIRIYSWRRTSSESMPRLPGMMQVWGFCSSATVGVISRHCHRRLRASSYPAKAAAAQRVISTSMDGSISWSPSTPGLPLCSTTAGPGLVGDCDSNNPAPIRWPSARSFGPSSATPAAQPSRFERGPDGGPKTPRACSSPGPRHRPRFTSAGPEDFSSATPGAQMSGRCASADLLDRLGFPVCPP